MSLSTLAILLGLVFLLYWAVRSRTEHDRGAPAGRARRPCPTGKVPFARRDDADQVVRRSRTNRGSDYDRPLQRSYRCPHCGAWHTTSQRKRTHW